MGKKQPHNYKGHAVSTSDVLILNDEGVMTTYYVNKDTFIEIPDFMKVTSSESGGLTKDTVGYEIAGKDGTWEVIDYLLVEGKNYFLMEHEQYGKDVAYVVLDQKGNVLVDSTYNGFDDVVKQKILDSLHPPVQEQTGNSKPKLDNWQNASLGNWTMLGYFIGGMITIFLSMKKVHFKYIFAGGFVMLGLAALFMYFEVQTAGLYERMKYPVIIRTIGMMILYALTAAYANQRMPYKYLSTWICIMLTVRMVLGPGAGTAIYTNVMQHRQQHYVTRFAHDMDQLNTEVAASYNQTVQGMMYQGKSEKEAHNMAALSTKGRVQVQATLAAVKEMSGWTFYGCIACAVLMLVIPWRKRKLDLQT